MDLPARPRSPRCPRGSASHRAGPRLRGGTRAHRPAHTWAVSTPLRSRVLLALCLATAEPSLPACGSRLIVVRNARVRLVDVSAHTLDIAALHSPVRQRGRSSWQASGSAAITRSAGFSSWPKKNQCHQLAAKRASQRASASPMGTASSTARRSTDAGWSSAVRSATYAPRSWPTTAKRAWPEHARQLNTVARHRALRVRLVIRRGRRLRRFRSHAGRDRRQRGAGRAAALRGAMWRGSADGRAAAAPAARRRRAARSVASPASTKSSAKPSNTARA